MPASDAESDTMGNESGVPRLLLLSSLALPLAMGRLPADMQTAQWMDHLCWPIKKALNPAILLWNLSFAIFMDS